jgi:hypothetical protein
MALEWYDVWVMSGYVVLPFPGSWSEQPYYVRKTFIYYQKLEAWHQENAKRPDLSLLPRMDDAS